MLSMEGLHVLIVGSKGGVAYACKKNIAECQWARKVTCTTYLNHSIMLGAPYFDISTFNCISAVPGLSDYDAVIYCSYLQTTSITSEVEFYSNFFAAVSLVNSWSEQRQLNNIPGSFVFISSESTRFGLARNPLYSCAKAALTSYLKCAQNIYGSSGIRFNSISPGYISDHGMASTSFDDPLKRENRARVTIAQRWALAHEIASVASFLASPDSSYVYGQNILVDGGKSILELT